MFIMLTDRDGDFMFVDSEQIIGFKKDPCNTSLTYVAMKRGRVDFSCKETPVQIEALICGVVEKSDPALRVKAQVFVKAMKKHYPYYFDPDFRHYRSELNGDEAEYCTAFDKLKAELGGGE